MKYRVITFCIFFLLIYIALSGIAILGGIFGSTGGNKNCNGRPLRIEKYFPAYKIGCYLFEEL